jgi:hypothetical protein
MTPDIGKFDKVVFSQGGIYLYDGNSTTQIISDAYAWVPRINDSGLIVYESSQGSIGKICLYDNGTITDIATNGFNSYPDINNKGQIVWAGYDGTHYRIYLAQPTTFPPPIVPLVPSVIVPMTNLLLNE